MQQEADFGRKMMTPLSPAFLASASSLRARGVSWWLKAWPPLWCAGWLSLLVTVLPLVSESRELTEPLMWEPLESRELPEGKGSLGAGERQRGMPPRLEQEPVGESRSLGGWGAEPCSARLPRSTSSPFTELTSSCQMMELESGTFSASGMPEPGLRLPFSFSLVPTDDIFNCLLATATTLMSKDWWNIYLEGQGGKPIWFLAVEESVGQPVMGASQSMACNHKAEIVGLQINNVIAYATHTAIAQFSPSSSEPIAPTTDSHVETLLAGEAPPGQSQRANANMALPSVVVLPLLIVVAAGVYYIYNEVIHFMSQSIVRNKVVVITDAVSGLGTECAHLFHKGGARLILCGNTWDKLESLYDQLTDDSDPSQTFAPKLVIVDFSDMDSMEDVVSEVVDCYGCVDVLISNSSMKLKAPVQSVSLEMDRNIMDMNTSAPALWLKVGWTFLRKPSPLLFL
ncbi:hypothetical protein F7725_014755 [Dissostichus mawsoni]|uniref:Uncharacterized protein n=1 Tax=Dissostichus mawsoni TaxID=36200 RepID=A0A7J5YZV8_DISMA|nr:hypothetical protein F7725_014755 [Dissostichus mawsoni]